MSNSVRIKTTPNGGDKYLKVKLDQDFDFIEILSLQLTQEETYRKFCSDYGVIVGRVIVNSGFGVPNAKVSVFIPIDDDDKNNSVIRGLYPYETITDKNSDGVRYNLLPKVAESDNECFTPVGTLPSKREVLDDATVLDIYCKYYKYTTTTNYAGDFMIFGVPLGTYTLHVDADLSDIGPLSQRPYDLIRQGSPANLFDSSTKFKADTNLDKLTQIKSTNVGVNVQPFWGDVDNCEIGITRIDIDLNYTIAPAAIFMGSIYGDQSKNSVNKRCRPRKQFGQLCEQVAGQGTIEILRKTIDGEVEEFSVDGGRVIDDDGTWAFQLPMNLDYVVTNEAGDLIPSNDPSIGIPTRSSVRFRIGMDENGGEGRLRTRAKYLVPNNPPTKNDIDYEFSELTKSTSFKDFYWNKIYTVSNFIPRYQLQKAIGDGENTRNFAGMKDVDACVGDKNPFPFNRINTQINPIFFIICLIITIVTLIISIINIVVIPIINGILGILIKIIKFLNKFGFNINEPSYIACISVQCPTDDASTYAPGCRKGSLGYKELLDPPTEGNLTDCLAFQMAQALNIYQFDFYNDWTTGSLYTFLLKYKKRLRASEKFCEYDCSEFRNDPNYSGVDGNNNGIPDNTCHNQMLLDTCFSCNSPNCQNVPQSTNTVPEGLVKKYKDELYYASTNHNASLKLFATDITCLGSVFDCDWQGFPKLQPLLVETSYKLPPETADTESLSNNTEVLIESGMVGTGYKGLFFEIDCIGLHVDSTQCLNIRHACEIFVDGDESTITGNTITDAADGVLGIKDIDNTFGKEFRDSYIILNSGTTSLNSYSFNSNMNSSFNINNKQTYNNVNNIDNGEAYASFRGFNPSNDNTYSQPKHSFYMYFGLFPGKTALDKMNDKFFNTCVPIQKVGIVIDATSSASTQPIGTLPCNGKISFTPIGGIEPYTYTVSSSNGYNTSGNTSLGDVLDGLCEGVYTINVIDSLGYPATQIVSVGGVLPLTCLVGVKKNATTDTSNDGEITVFSVYGGVPPYTFKLQNSLGVIINSITSPSIPYTFTGLDADVLGYTVTVEDSASSPACVTTGLTITGPSPLILTATVTGATCSNVSDGKISLTYAGGQPPYNLETTGTTDTSFISNSANLTGLLPDTYISTLTDSNGLVETISTTIVTLSPPLVLAPVSSAILSKQCNPNAYVIPFEIVLNSGGSYGLKYIEYIIDGSFPFTTIQTGQQYTPSNNIMTITINSIINNSIEFRLVDGDCRSQIISYNASAFVRPTTALSGSGTRSNTTYTITPTPNSGIGPYRVTYGSITTPSSLTTITFTSQTPYQSVTLLDSVGCSIPITIL